MSENPFDALGGGGFDMNALLQQAQQLQEQVAQAQERLAAQSFTGSAGGSVVVTVAGSGDLTGVQITAGSFDGASAEDLEDLSDLLVAAFRDAKSKVDAEAATALGPLAGGAEGVGGFPGLG